MTDNNRRRRRCDINPYHCINFCEQTDNTQQCESELQEISIEERWAITEMVTPDILGNYDEATVAQLDQLALRLNGDKLNLAWTICDLTAQFISNYFSSLYAHENNSTERRRMILEHSYSVNYVMNELMENAVKFRVNGYITVKIGLLDNLFCCALSNIASRKNAGKLYSALKEITNGDAQNLLLQRFEANALKPENNASGLGFLTMINDYGVNLGCKFENCRDQPETILVDTLITLPINKA